MTSKKDKKIEIVPLSLIEADKDQPRRNFNPARMAELIKSIKKHGIMNPMLVEPRKSGGYLLIDGERRYRASKELKFSEVPVIIMPANDETQRLIQQFHLQEQHEGWTPLEKAIATNRLAKSLGVGIEQLAETLSLPRRTISDYVAFSKLLERSSFEKSEIPIDYASGIVALRVYAKKRYQEQFEREFPHSMERALEKAVINRFTQGLISKRTDLLKVHDSIRMDAGSIEKFIKNTKMSPDKLFMDSKARVAWYMRNIVNCGSVLSAAVSKGLPLGVDKMFTDNTKAISIVKNAYRRLGELVNKL